jgi:hypothetical protein
MFKFKNLKTVNSVATVIVHPSNVKLRPREVDVNRQKLEEKEEKEIFHLFAVADRYAFDNIRKHLVTVIDANEVEFDPVRKLLIGSEHNDLRHWVMPAFKAIVKRSKGLTVDEMSEMGYERLAAIFTARERFLKDPYFEPSSVTLSQAFYHA